MRFPPSLHPISLARAFQASARRTPDKLAVVGEDASLTYAQLMKEAAGVRNRTGTIGGAPQAAVIVDWLGAMMKAESAEEHAPAATVMEGGEAVTLSHRTLALRALNCMVEHAAFGRERATLAVALPLDCARALVAATVSLWLGSTLRLARAGSGLELVSSGECETAWLGRLDWDAPTSGRPSPPASFRLLICDGLPPEPVRSNLRDWLGASRVTAETGSIATGKLFRHPGLAAQGEPFVGALCG
jgi:hypothetical protein